MMQRTQSQDDGVKAPIAWFSHSLGHKQTVETVRYRDGR